MATPREAPAHPASLDDKYRLDSGRAFMSGVQALVRLPMLQRTRDAALGLNTAGFISGYRGSPLGTYDQALWSARQHLARHHIHFQPGVNEELAATAVWGTQQLALHPASQRFDGVFGLWYGKGPGADRCADVFKHANMAGTAPHGGVIAVAGDDHAAKSSSAAHQSDHLFKACGLPVFFPSSVQSILDLGLHAWALSRFSGLWVGMKTIQEVVESASSVWVDADRVQIAHPDDFAMPAGGLHIRWPDPPLAQEARLMDHKWYAALAYIRANRLNHNVIDGPNDRFGLIASGKAYNDTRQALHDLGLDTADCQRLGIRLHQVNVVWPLEATLTRAFAQGLQEILVIEEKRQVIEYQLKEELYNWRADVRPNVLGKFDESEGDETGGEWSRPNPSGHWLLRAQADLNPALIAQAIGRRLKKLGVDADTAAHIDARLALIEAKQRSAAALTLGQERPPHFCSGCPHNTSTRVPEGSRALAGIGCHYMALWMDRATTTFTQMGGEGVTWVGQAPFTTEPHVFANLGDGTYFHSGLLAVRQAIAARVNITYKILYNDAVAMTGGQPVDGLLQVPEITRELHAEGASRIVVVSDEPAKYEALRHRLAPGVTVHHRDELDALQRLLRDTPGCTILIYDQTCATEKRRRRKRGLMPAAPERVVINERVCEGCGDCGVQSNCLSVEPVDTAFGRKRRINQHSCNQDLSCLKGFCPSFVSVRGGTLRKRSAHTEAHSAPGDPQAAAQSLSLSLPRLPEPPLARAQQAYGIVIAGIGGTGVITLGQVLGMAAHLEGLGVITQEAAGLAQKGGATWSHVQIACGPEAIYTTKVGTAEADLVIACDGLVAAHPSTVAVMHEGRTRIVLSTHDTPTANALHQRDWQYPRAACEDTLRRSVGSDQVLALDAEALAVQLLGDSIYANPLLLGVAWQRGLLPVSRESLLQAMALNGTQVSANQAAFEWGRHAAQHPEKLQAALAPAQPITVHRRPSLDELIRTHETELTQYQSAAFAAQYRDVIERVRSAEAPLSPRLALTETVARSLFKLMAIKDEYEVARLLCDPRFHEQIAAQFDGPYTLHLNLAPPLLARPGPDGRPRKTQFGPWLWPVLRGLRHLKFLRGRWADPFGHTAERRAERALLRDYLGTVDELLRTLRADTLDSAIEIAQLPQAVRGYGPVRDAAMASTRHKWSELRQRWQTTATRTDGRSEM